MTNIFAGMPPGILLRRTQLIIPSVSSQRFVVGELTNLLKVLILGGGGAGGGCAATTTTVSSGGGGASGAWQEFLMATTPGAVIFYAVGLAGVPVSGGVGGSGGTSSFPFSVVQAFGGAGGDLGVSGGLLTRGGVGGSTVYTSGIISTPLRIPSAGNPGGEGIGMSAGTVRARGGFGASCPWGAGTWDVIANNGQTGSGVNASANQYGAGGCGAANSGTQSAQAGSIGCQGLIIVEEYTG